MDYNNCQFSGDRDRKASELYLVLVIRCDFDRTDKRTNEQNKGLFKLFMALLEEKLISFLEKGGKLR